MQKLIIHQLGPVTHCELDIHDFTIFTGPQSSGKSTVAKSIFLFQNIRNILYTQLVKKSLWADLPMEDSMELNTKNRLLKAVRATFLQTFGSTWHMDNSMYLYYSYTDDIYIKISLRQELISPNYIWIDFSDALVYFLSSFDTPYLESPFLSSESSTSLKEKINTFFHDDTEAVYIPAGRSMITLLSSQLNYIYSFMDDIQKRNLDYCTQNYLERILQLKPAFTSGASHMIQNTLSLTDTRIDKDLVFQAAELMHLILQGEYLYVDGEERLLFSNNKYVKINFASSGQQESLWILNVLFYYLLNNKRAYFIIEEPESHLFPNAQKLITEFIALAQCNYRNKIFITTHSPYILGTINNLLYASKISTVVSRTDLESIISAKKWVMFEHMAAYFMENGEPRSCTDLEFESIENEIIDGASADINNDFDSMVLLKEKTLPKDGDSFASFS